MPFTLVNTGPAPKNIHTHNYGPVTCTFATCTAKQVEVEDIKLGRGVTWIVYIPPTSDNQSNSLIHSTNETRRNPKDVHEQVGRGTSYEQGTKRKHCETRALLVGWLTMHVTTSALPLSFSPSSSTILMTQQRQQLALKQTANTSTELTWHSDRWKRIAGDAKKTAKMGRDGMLMFTIGRANFQPVKDARQ